MANGNLKRYTAYKLSVGMIAKGNSQFDKDRFRNITLEGKEISRIHVIATVIEKFLSEEKPYGTLTIDDGTGNIRIKTFSDTLNLIKNIEPGDCIRVIGTIRYFSNELYILPEIVKPVDTRWLLARRLELKKEYPDLYKEAQQPPQQPQQPTKPAPQQQQQPTAQPEVKVEKIKEEKIEEQKIEDKPKGNLRDQILDLVKGAEAEEGIDIDSLIMKLSQPVEQINSTITELLEAGEIYEPRPGRLRIL